MESPDWVEGWAGLFMDAGDEECGIGVAACVLVGMDFPILGEVGGMSIGSRHNTQLEHYATTPVRTVSGESRDIMPCSDPQLLPGCAARI